MAHECHVTHAQIQRFNFDQKIPHPIAERLDAWFMQQCALLLLQLLSRIVTALQIRHFQPCYQNSGICYSAPPSLPRHLNRMSLMLL
jgi:hypothetical protein